jgi:hypothetical protein
VRPAHSALRGRRLYLLTLTGADACHRMMRRSGMHPMWGPVGLACAPNVGCAGHVLMYTRMAPRPGGRRWRGPAVLAVRTELIADATDVGRDAPRYAAALHRCQPRCSEIRRESPDVSRDAPRLSTQHRNTGGRGEVAVHIQSGCAGVARLNCGTVHEHKGCARIHVSKHIYSLASWCVVCRSET